jgi:hypothetical protein
MNSIWVMPAICAVASAAFYVVGLTWVSGFAGGATMVMVQINMYYLRIKNGGSRETVD